MDDGRRERVDDGRREREWMMGGGREWMMGGGGKDGGACEEIYFHLCECSCLF